jgi:hypothetical protein
VPEGVRVQVPSPAQTKSPGNLEFPGLNRYLRGISPTRTPQLLYKSFEHERRLDAVASTEALAT